MALSALKLVLVFFVNFLMCHLKFSKPVIEGIPLSHVSSWNASRWEQAEAALPPCSAARPLRAHLDSVRSSAGADPGLPLWGSRRQSQQPLLHLLIDLLANRCLLSVSSCYLWIFSPSITAVFPLQWGKWTFACLQWKKLCIWVKRIINWLIQKRLTCVLFHSIARLLLTYLSQHRTLASQICVIISCVLTFLRVLSIYK